MKIFLPFFVFFFLAFAMNAQLVITEISYNPPESGTDSLEYIELYNETSADIDLTDYVIRDNNPHTIAGGVVPANGYAILAINPGAIMAVLGVSSIEIADIALSNSGEPLFLEDPNGNLIDDVVYDDNEPWPTFDDGTDGQGATIELCDVTSDNNDASNWNVSTNNLGVMVGGILFLGTPNAENSASCEFVPDYVVEVSSNVFTPKDITIQVNESIRWVNTGGFHNVNGGTDVYPDNPEAFGNGAAAGGTWVYDFTFTIPGVYDYQCDPHVSLGMVGTVTVEGDVEPTIPTYDIGIINTINADGVGDSIGTVCIIEGVTHGANLSAGGLQFALIDDSGDAIGLFSSGNFGYTYAEGDKIKAAGVIDQFNGLLQIEPTAVELISSGNPLTGPVVVDILDESTESKLVTVECVVIVDANDWIGDGSDFNVDFMSSTGEIITLRIDADTEAASWEEGPLVSVDGCYNITGIGGQFDSDSPFLSGYQMFPRYISDFDLRTSVEDELEAEIKLFPNPTLNYLHIESDIDMDRYVMYNQFGELVMTGKFKKTLDVGELPSGGYVIVLFKDDKSRAIHFVK